jgi:predicted phosphoribosyltransferase
MFRDRHDAAEQLAARLGKYRDQNPLVLGIPRGGVVIGSILARALNGELDIVLTRKLRAPGNLELAMGAIDERGTVYLNSPVVDFLRVTDEIIEEETALQLHTIRSRAEAYRRIHPKIPLEGRVVILTDDGMATGATMRTAVQMARAAGPQRLVVALPVGPPESVTDIEREVDEMVCLCTPADFTAVGQFYLSFDQVEDDEVERILSEFGRTPE